MAFLALGETPAEKVRRVTQEARLKAQARLAPRPPPPPVAQVSTQRVMTTPVTTAPGPAQAARQTAVQKVKEIQAKVAAQRQVPMVVSQQPVALPAVSPAQTAIEKARQRIQQIREKRGQATPATKEVIAPQKPVTSVQLTAQERVQQAREKIQQAIQRVKTVKPGVSVTTTPIIGPQAQPFFEPTPQPIPSVPATQEVMAPEKPVSAIQPPDIRQKIVDIRERLKKRVAPQVPVTPQAPTVVPTAVAEEIATLPPAGQAELSKTKEWQDVQTTPTATAAEKVRAKVAEIKAKIRQRTTPVEIGPQPQPMPQPMPQPVPSGGQPQPFPVASQPYPNGGQVASGGGRGGGPISVPSGETYPPAPIEAGVPSTLFGIETKWILIAAAAALVLFLFMGRKSVPGRKQIEEE